MVTSCPHTRGWELRSAESCPTFHFTNKEAFCPGPTHGEVIKGFPGCNYYCSKTPCRLEKVERLHKKCVSFIYIMYILRFLLIQTVPSISFLNYIFLITIFITESALGPLRSISHDVRLCICLSVYMSPFHVIYLKLVITA